MMTKPLSTDSINNLTRVHADTSMALQPKYGLGFPYALPGGFFAFGSVFQARVPSPPSHLFQGFPTSLLL